MNYRWRGNMLVLFSAVSFGLMPIFARFAYGNGVGVQELLFLRFFLAFLLMGVFLKLTDRSPIPSKNNLLVLLALGGIGYFLQSILYFTALLYTPVSVAALVLYTYPAFVITGSLILGLEKFSTSIVLTLFIALVGLVLVANPVINVAFVGISIGLGASITYTVYIIVSTRVLKRVSAKTGSFYVMGASSLSFFVSGLLSNNLHFAWNFEAWFWVLTISIICTFLAITAFFQGLKIIGPSRTSILSIVELVTSVLVASVIFNDLLSVTQLIGGSLILLATILAALKK